MGGFLGFSKRRGHVGPEVPGPFLIWEFGKGLQAGNLKNMQSQDPSALTGLILLGPTS